MKVSALLIVLAACGGGSGDVAPDAAGDGAIPFTPDTCSGSPLALYGATTQPADQPIYGPVTLDTAGITICLSLDGRDNANLAHFGAITDGEMADASTFELSVYDTNDVLIEMGWDVTIGNSSPMSYANVEHSFEKGQVYQVKLRARAKQAAATTRISLSLLCPLE